MIFSLQLIEILFFCNSTDDIEVEYIIISLNPSKAIGPNSITTKILKLFFNDVSPQLTELLNISLFCGVFPLILKTDSHTSLQERLKIKVLQDSNKIRATRQWKFCLWIFVDCQKAFHTVDHDITLQKVNHYGIRGVAKYWFSAYRQNRQQYVRINGLNLCLSRFYSRTTIIFYLYE